MAKMTKTQHKRLIQQTYSKVEKLYFANDSKVTLKELEAVRKMCQKWQRLLK